MKYFSLFSGIGGFELGIHNAYVETANRTKNGRSEATKKTRGGKGYKKSEGVGPKGGWAGEYNHGSGSRQKSFTCVGYSEIDKYATKIYQKHFRDHKNYGDITKIKPNKLPDFDLLVGGFPCQAFSIAGKRKGFKDTRGTLFFDIARILRSKKPKLFLLENVKGLLSHDNGSTFKTIIATLTKLGYDVQWQVLNSKNFGVPQNRERVFIVGHLRGTARPKVFPFTENNSEDIVLPTITTRVTADSNGTYVGKRSPRQIIGGSQGNRVYDPNGISVTLASQAGGLGAKTGLYAVRIKEATKKGFTEAKVGQSINLAVPNSKTRRGRVSDIAQTLDTGMQQHTLTPDMKIRRLTPKECERLQGFPDGWTEGISDTQRYKCLGNAVTVNAVQAIMQKLI
jgi:DNA (cytosine-5)-methyltransferase 1